MRKWRDMTQLGDSISTALKRHHLDKRTKQEIAAANWAEVVGEKCAAASRPEAMRDGILFVSCKSAAWAQELTFLKDHIIQEMNKRAGENVVTDIRFSGKGLRKIEEAVKVERDEPTAGEIEAVKLGKNEIERASRAVEGVKDAVLAQKIRSAIEAGQKLQRWKLAHGWTKCSKCGVLFKGPGKNCGICG